MLASSEILAAVFRRCEIWTLITRTIPVAVIIIEMSEVANSSSSSSRRKSRTESSFIVAQSMVGLLHRKPGSTWTADSCSAQDNSKC